MAIATANDTQVIVYGPFLGSMRSVTGDLVPPEFIASIKDFTAANNYNDTDSSNNMLYLPRTGSWKLRGGSSVKFDTYGSLVGLLPDKWEDDPNGSSLGSRVRHFEEFLSDSISDGIPTVIALLTRETVPSTLLDDGRFSNVYIRDQVNSVNYTLGDEYSTSTTYPAVGNLQYYRIVPLWYESGDGGLTRGVSEFHRRNLFNGSRRFLKVGNWWHFPSRLGTPSRWRGSFAAGNALGGTSATSMVSAGAWTAQDGTTATDLHTYIDELPADDTDYVQVRLDSAGGGQVSLALGIASPSPTPSTSTPHVIQFRYRRTGGSSAVQTLNFVLYKNGAGLHTVTSQSIATPSITTAWTDYSYTLSAAEVADLAAATNGGAYANMRFYFNWSGAFDGGSPGPYFQVSMWRFSIGVAVTSTTLESRANYLIPTGPFPPTHAGSIAAGNLAAGANTAYLEPDGTADASTWTVTGASAHAALDDVVGTPDDADYVSGTASQGPLKITLDSPGFTPTSDLYNVTMWNRVRKTSAAAVPGLSVDLYQGSTQISTGNVAFASSFTTSFANYSYQLTDAEVNLITDWTDLQFWYLRNSTAGTIEVSQSWLEITPIGESSGGWKGKDRFLRACAYRFEDGSIWAGTTPRFPNSTLDDGFNLTTVDSANPEATYDKIVWSNIPVPPKGVTHVQLWRTPKIDSTVDDNLQLNPTDMRFIDEVPAGITTYDDYKGDDNSLGLDAEQYFIRYDHIMQPRTRYMAGGDMRVIASYGGTNPCAITIAPIGRLADYDLNTADNVAATYGSGTSDASYMRVGIDASSVVTVTLARDTGAALTTRTFTSDSSGDVGSLTTIQALVDAINDTSIADTPNCGQWRAQLCPGVDGTAALTALCPHHRVIASCVTATSTALTKPAGGLSKVAVGARVTGTNVAANTYVVAIVSDTELTLSAATTGSATNDMTFFYDLGDTPTGSPSGYQRVIANSLPGFIYFTKTYLDTQTFDKSATWMTVASPGSVKAAPNCWSGKLSNRFTPPLGAGFVQGGGAVDHGFVVLYANKVGAIRPRGPDSFTDQEYGLVIIDESRGCCAWNTIIPGNRFVPFLSTEGLFAADLRDVRLLTEQTYVDQPVAVGDFYYEAPKCVAATAMDVDVYNADTTIGAYAWARIARGVLYVGYRSGNSGGTTHCDRMVRLDFTSGDEATGLPALFRRPGLVWGWSTPLLGSGSGTSAIYRYALITEARRSDGLHIYGWNEENAGTTGDGRIDEIETGTTDPSSTAITGKVEMPWYRPPDGGLVSFQEVVLEHGSPVSSTGSLVFHRTLSDETYTLTPGTSSLPMYSEMKLLPFNTARANCNAGYWDYRQATGSARELRRLVVKFKPIRRFKT